METSRYTEQFVKPQDNALNRENPSLRRVEEVATINEHIVVGLRPETQNHIVEAVKSVFPEHHFNPGVLSKDFPKPRVVEFSPREKITENGLAIIDLGGVQSTGPGAANAAAEIFNEAHLMHSKSREFPPPAFGITVSSPISGDTRDSTLSVNPVERAASYAGLISEMIAAHPEIKHIAIVSRSLAAVDAVYIVPILEKILQQSNSGAEISGFLLTLPGGVIEQSPLQFAPRILEGVKLLQEVDEAYPSWITIVRERYKLENMERNEKNLDPNMVLRERMRLDKMIQRYMNPKDLLEKRAEGLPKNTTDSTTEVEDQRPRLTEEKKEQLRIIDEQMEVAWVIQDKDTLERFQKERYKLLQPIVSHAIRDTESRHDISPFVINSAKGIGNLVKTGKILFNGEGALVTQVPENVRSLIHVPVGVLAGEHDVLFPRNEVEKSLKNKKLFPNALVEIRREAAEFAHNSHGSNAPRYAQMCVNILEKMMWFNAHHKNPMPLVQSSLR